MRCLQRNKKGFWYSLLSQTISDGDEPYNVYSLPTYMEANISAATGVAQAAMFGNAQDYDRVIVTDELNCPIDENAVLWVDKSPEYELDSNNKPTIPTAWDYIVKRVARPLDSVSYAIKKVDVS